MTNLWDSLIAIGTVALAVATTYLAYHTRGLARAAEADQRAQWRPVLLVTMDRPDSRAMPHDRDAAHLRVRVRNAGRGPALYIRTQLDPGGHSPDSWPNGALASGEEQELAFPGAEITQAGPFQLLFDYRDLADRTYSSSITLEARPGQPPEHRVRVYDVHVWEDHAVTAHGESVYPQPGLSDRSPRSRPGPRRRLRAALNSLRGNIP